MFSFHFPSLRETLISAAGAAFCSAVLVAAAVLPADTVAAAVLHL